MRLAARHNTALLLPGPASEAALLTSFAGRIYDDAPQQNANPLGASWTDLDMADKSPDENLQQAVRVQERFDFYALALTFTVLGLSVQTGPALNPVATILELGSWACLLASGLVGLARIEDIPHLYRLASLKGDYETRAAGIRKAQVQGVRSITALDLGEARPTEELLQNATSSVEKIEKALKPHSDRIVTKYKWQKRLFIAGFSLLFVARAYSPLVRAIREFAR